MKKEDRFWTSNDMFSDMCMLPFLVMLPCAFLYNITHLSEFLAFAILFAFCWFYLWITSPQWFINFLAFIFRRKIENNFKIIKRKGQK